MAHHLVAGRRYVVRRFHSEMGQTWSAGLRLTLEQVVAKSGERFYHTEFHFRDLATGQPRRWVIDAPQADDTGRDLFQAEPA